ncbi:hypothetical protein DB88DRAFT_481372 [Papiliotrema laurentii]|uniref:Uncharacterized protein n=1 Tax=Papiliotrema laurentii TaxID=5418 RepID=A0AAD9L7N8_PAPLA|nr:hypothetical protein DB88DRAFT_481372 [Papiliotrema laurentii]
MAQPNGTAPGFLTPCGSQNFDYSQTQIVNVSQIIEVTFLGTPPYNLTRTIFGNNTVQCGIPAFPDWDGSTPFVLENNTFQWTVEPPYRNFTSGTNKTTLVPVPGDAVMFVAVERGIASGSTGSSNHNFWFSANYTLYDTANPTGRPPNGAASTRSPLKAGFMLGLLAIPTLLSIVCWEILFRRIEIC